MSQNDFKSKFQTGAEVLQKLLESQAGPVSDQYLRWKLWLNWKDIVGPTISAHSEPISYRNGLLWLWVENSVWMQQMGFMAETMNQSEKSNTGNHTSIAADLERLRTEVPTAVVTDGVTLSADIV